MVAYTNFYENVKEAEMRLKGTVVLYDGVPHYVLCIDNHKADGIFRIYMEPTGQPNGLTITRVPGIPYQGPWAPTFSTRGAAMDHWMEANPSSTILRKMMNSPAFNKFRPFPLGMLNYRGSVYYMERHPTRKSEQGLTSSMLVAERVTLSGSRGTNNAPDALSNEFTALILGDYPSISECIVKLKDSETVNDAVAFHRDFALVRGPVDMLFLAYKQNIVGVLTHSSLVTVKLGKKFLYTREVVEALGLFGTVTE